MYLRAMNSLVYSAFAFVILFCGIESHSATMPEALERYEIGDLTVIEVVMHSDTYNQSIAIILGSDGYVYTAIRGNYVGRNKGVLVKINNDGIVVSEVDKDGNENLIFMPVKAISYYQ